jgi:hypothetical protein
VRTHVASIEIAAPPEAVAAFVADGAKLPIWAIGFAKAVDRDGDGWQVRFSDGRPFHALDLRDGACAVAHPCGEDRYEGEYRVSGPDELEVRWRVRGPSKDGRIASRYRRA